MKTDIIKKSAIDKLYSALTLINSNEFLQQSAATINTVNLLNETLKKTLEDILHERALSRITELKKIGRMIVDSWPVDSSIGDVVLQAKDLSFKYNTRLLRNT